MEYAELKKTCIDLEHFITPAWAANLILDREVLTQTVVDPCAGTGVLSDAVREHGYTPLSIDIFDWGYHGTFIQDYLEMPYGDFTNGKDFTVFMNPPFSKACEFVEHSFALGARKVVMFQRWAFLESDGRREFFEKYPLSRQYLHCDRVNCWRFDLPVNEKGKRYDPEKNNKELSSSPTAYGWLVWEKGQETTAPPTFRLYKD